jgi:Flp pilus assembly protein TadB
LGIFLWFSNRDYLQPLLDATMGRIALVAGGILMAGGIYWLRKIVDIEV